MKVVICDDDPLLRSMLETVVERHGHEIVGIADNTAIGTQLVTAARPDVVVVDLSLGYNTDFDIIDAAAEVGSRVIVFSRTADHAVLDQYDPRPVVVEKPDFDELERALGRVAPGDEPVAAERRRRPPRAAIGPQPTGLGDAQAFYEALGNAAGGDALLAVDHDDDADSIAKLVRGSDRVLDTGSKVLVFLAGGGDLGIEALRARLAEHAPGSAGDVRSLVVAADETGSDAFARLKSLPADPS